MKGYHRTESTDTGGSRQSWLGADICLGEEDYVKIMENLLYAILLSKKVVIGRNPYHLGRGRT